MHPTHGTPLARTATLASLPAVIDADGKTTKGRTTMSRSSWRTIALGLALVGVMQPGGLAPVAAQEATPTAGVGGSTGCTAAPRATDELIALWFGPEGTPLATPTGQPPVASTADLPQGEPADAATTAAVSATMHDVFACFDAGQYARAFALMTDNGVKQFGPDLSDPSEDTAGEVTALLEGQLAGTPIPGEEIGQQTMFSEAREARVLPDGRVGAIFASDEGLIFALFQQGDGGWLLDDFILIMNAEATPTS